MMWLLSACTNFLVTASSMICFTYKRQKQRVRDQDQDVAPERGRLGVGLKIHDQGGHVLPKYHSIQVYLKNRH